MHAARRYADFHTHIHIRPKIHRLRFNMMEIQGFSKGITQTIKVWYSLISFKCVAPGGSHVALRGVPLVCLFLACRGFWGGACLCVPSYSLSSDFVGKTISPRVAGLQPQNLRRTLWRRSLTETLWKPNKDVQSYWFYTGTTQTAQATAGLPGHGSPLCKATWQQSKDLRVSCQVWALVNARYTWSLYFTLTTLTTVGYGHWAADRCYGHILVAVPCCSLLCLAVGAQATSHLCGSASEQQKWQLDMPKREDKFEQLPCTDWGPPKSVDGCCSFFSPRQSYFLVFCACLVISWPAWTMIDFRPGMARWEVFYCWRFVWILQGGKHRKLSKNASTVTST